MSRFGNFGRVRPAAVAGRFYPGEPSELRRVVESLLATAQRPAGPGPKALIAPHAGYIYSGPIAASAYALLLSERDRIKRIVLLGPSHFVAFDGLAATSADAFATPLGQVPVDIEAGRALSVLSQVTILDEAHVGEHALEVHLPFLQVVLADFTLVPLLAGDATPEQVRQALDVVWGGPETRIVVSSDLSHYLDYSAARRTDHVTAKAIEALRPGDIAENQACGRIPICGLLEAAARRRLRARTVDLRSSGDTAGPRHQVVGYGAFILENQPWSNR
jgi:MEMO1 family protein